MSINLAVTPDFAANELAAEPYLLEHLRAHLPERVRVFSAADLAGVQNQDAYAPAVHVIYGGEPGAAEGNEMQQRRRQRWLIVVAVRQIRAIGEVRSEAGELLAQVRLALGPERPAGLQTLVRETMPAPLYRDAMAYFPILYTLEILALRGLGGRR